RLLRPQRALREPEQRAPAGRTDLLIVRGAALAHLVAKAELAFDRDEIANHLLRRERPVAALAPRLLAARALVLVEAHAELRRALEDVEELAERQPQKRHDHGDGVEDREEVERVATQPRVAH